MKYEVIMKPISMSKKAGKTRRPEYRVSVEASGSNEAALVARRTAESEGFAGYAITKIKEIEQ